MPSIDISPLVDSLLILLLAFLIDLIFGEPPDEIHPTVWIGNLIAYFKPKIRSSYPKKEKNYGILMGLIVIVIFSVPVLFGLFWVQLLFGKMWYIIASAILLKPTFALKCMKQYTIQIADAISKKDEGQARQLLPYIVRRDPAQLSERHIISATVESIGEGTVDGITSPMFYFALFGVPGAVAYRVINTLDSMVGYRDREHINIGWFSARIDTIANYVSARLTAILIVVSALLLRENWRGSWSIMQRDRNVTESLNAGWTMSAMAGTFNVQLEKPGFYVIGEDREDLSPEHIIRALKIMETTTYLFCILIVFPILLLKMLIVK
jgi:adenosylcobinamide-phosphate synthase